MNNRKKNKLDVNHNHSKMLWNINDEMVRIAVMNTTIHINITSQIYTSPLKSIIIICKYDVTRKEKERCRCG